MHATKRSRSIKLFAFFGLITWCSIAIGQASEETTLETPEILLRKANQAPQPYGEPDAAQRYAGLKRQSTSGAEVADLYFEAQKQMRDMPHFSTRRGVELELKSIHQRLPTSARDAMLLGTWEPLGPGNIGGRTRAVLIDPNQPNILYAAGVSGGIWKTTNGGGTWRPLADMLPTIAVSSMAMDPADSNVLYAGTGEGQFRETIRGTGLPLRGAGIFRSENAGNSWQRLPSTNNVNFHWVNDVIVSPNNSQRLYAATRTGVWRSNNRGTSWQRVLDPQVQGGCFDLVVRSDRDNDFLLAACGTFEQATIYRNPNAEQSNNWQSVLTEPGMGRTSLAIAPSNQNIVYALSASYLPGPGANFDGGLHAVFRSNQGGAAGSWSARVRNTSSDKLSTLILTNPVIANLNACGFNGPDRFSTLGWYTNTIAVDPTDPSVVWAGGIDLFRSDDSGSSWGTISHWFVDGSAHADQHTLVFHPDYNGAGNQTLFVGGDGGVYRTDNARARKATGPRATCSSNETDVRWRPLNRNLGITQFYHGAPFPDGRRYLGGTQDNGTLLSSDAQGINGWREINGGDGGYVAVDPSNVQTLYVESQNFNFRKSTDGGNSFQNAQTGINDGGFLFITPFVLDPNDPQRLWTGGRRLWRTNDGAGSWQQASTDVNGGGQVSAVAVAEGNSERMLVGLNNGFILRNDQALAADANTAWPATRPRQGFVSSVAFDPNNANIAYATYAGFGGVHVWRTTDGGASWNPRDGQGSGRLPNIPIHAVLVNPNNTQQIYLGSDLGVFVSSNSGGAWAVENTGFANVVTESLSLSDGPNGQPHLFAFTHGRGAWRVPLATSNGGGGGGGGGGTGGGGGGGGGVCPLPPGHPNFCRDCGPCADGEGDCDRDSDCAVGLSCLNDIGADFGFGPGIDVCTGGSGGGGGGGTGGGGGGGTGGGCSLPAGHPDFCRECGPCLSGEGDCDRDSDCVTGATCRDNVGAMFGFGPGIDVCVQEGSSGACPLPSGHPDFCRECGPCASGQGDCDRDSDCVAGLSCVDNIGADFGFGPGIDVCR